MPTKQELEEELEAVKADLAQAQADLEVALEAAKAAKAAKAPTPAEKIPAHVVGTVSDGHGVVIIADVETLERGFVSRTIRSSKYVVDLFGPADRCAAYAKRTTYPFDEIPGGVRVHPKTPLAARGIVDKVKVWSRQDEVTVKAIDAATSSTYHKAAVALEKAKTPAAVVDLGGFGKAVVVRVPKPPTITLDEDGFAGRVT